MQPDDGPAALTADGELPPWFTPDDPWLTRRMRDMAAIAANEAELGTAVMSALAEFLETARRGLLGLPLTAAADVPPPPPDDGPELPPDPDGWPDVSVWRSIVDRFVTPVISGMFGERFKLETARAVIKDTPWRLDYLQKVWDRLKIWPQHAWEDIRPELLEGISEGESIRDLRDRVGRVLNIDAVSRAAQAKINDLNKIIADETRPAAERAAAREQRGDLYVSKRQEDKRWWFYAARIARTETLGAMNGGTYYGAQAYAEVTGETRYKQWWCLTPDTPVSASGITWVARRRHRGDVVTITTASGARLSLTPQHPVLTVAGWVVAGELTAGARVVRLPLGADAGEPIGPVAEASLEHGRARGHTREVDRTLRGVQQRVEVTAPDPYLIAPLVAVGGSVVADLSAHTTAVRLPALAAAALTTASGRAHRRPQHSAAMRAADRLSADEVTDVTVSRYDGWVYDLTTRAQFFSAGGLIVHNSTSDTRVRPSHWAAHMQVQPMDEKFKVGGHLLDHPGDPDGPGHEVINCRCSLLTMGKAEAEREAQRYEMYRHSRTDVNGNLLDEDGRPIVAAATAGGTTMTGPTTTTQPGTYAEDEPDAPPAQTDLMALLPPGATEVGWRGRLTPLDQMSGDRRIIATPEGGLSTRELPLAFLYQEKLGYGHDDASLIARIDNAWIDGGWVWGEGTIDLTDPDGVKAANKIHRGYHRWVSVDLDNVTSEWQCYDADTQQPTDCPEMAEEDLDWLFLPAGQRPALSPSQQRRARAAAARRSGTYAEDPDDPWAGIWEVEVCTDWRLMGATLVSQPAFHDATIELVFDYVRQEPQTGGGAADDQAAAVGESVRITAAQQAGTSAYSATGDTELPLAALDTAWEAGAAGERVATWADGDAGKLGMAHLWLDPEGDNTDPAAYGLLFADVVDDVLTAVPAAVMDCADQVDGLPDDDQEAVRASVDLLYGRMREQFGDPTLLPPWAGDDATDDDTGADMGNQAASVQPTSPPPARPHTPPTPAARAAGVTRRTSTAHRPVPRRPAGPHRSTLATALVASAAPLKPPAAWFANPDLAGPTPLTITDDGRVYGHAAIWDTCHVGYPGRCVTPPRGADYSYFHCGAVRTNDGVDIAVGSIVLGTDHADVSRNTTVAQAMSHYAHSGWGVAVVRAYEDDHGVVVAGSLAPDVDEEKLAALRRCTLSGDWRAVSGRPTFISALAVNVGGFTVRRQTDADGRMVALVAAGSLQTTQDRLSAGLDHGTAPAAGCQHHHLPAPEEYAAAVVSALNAQQQRAQVTGTLAARVYGQRVAALAARVHTPVRPGTNNGR